jgi:hypothetical protein
VPQHLCAPEKMSECPEMKLPWTQRLFSLVIYKIIIARLQCFTKNTLLVFLTNQVGKVIKFIILLLCRLVQIREILGILSN